MVKLTENDNSVKEYPAGTSAFDVLKEREESGGRTVAARHGDVIVDLHAVLTDGGEPLALSAVSLDTPEGLEIYRHSVAHVLAEAVKALYPDAKVTIGPVIEGGFFYDFDVPEPFTPEDLTKIEKKMKEIIKKGAPIKREEVSKNDAIKLFKEMGEDYKVEIIEELEAETVSLYRQEGFVDLCRGPHLPNTRRIKAIKLTSAAGAYWRGDEKNKMLQRIYGTAFPTKDELKEHLARLEEAKKRDHRRLGKELDLFSTSEDIGAGLVLWHPKGSVVRGVVEDFWKAEHVKSGYGLIYTPHIAQTGLWKTSGHWDFYQESLFSPMDVDGRDYIVKPMNCPFHIEIYKSNLRSYRDLPIRYAELGTVYRFERSGVLHGLLRVRGFTQDDAHIFMTPDQLAGEIETVLKFTLYILRSFGFNEFDVYLSTRPEKYVGTTENWEHAESSLKTALEAAEIDFEIDPGEGVFYGPKIDVKIKDVLGRSWQCSTIQVDFNLPERFDVTYRDSGGNEARPIMIHRALMGSLERFIGCLIEHYGGAFPVWLAPVQVIILTVTERCDEFATDILNELLSAGIRAEADKRNEKLGFKIREAELKKIPYMLVIGDKEVDEGKVSPRGKSKGEMDSMAVAEFIKMLNDENKPLGGGSL